MPSDTEEFQVVIKEREEGQEEYVLPAILREAEEQEESSNESAEDDEEENSSSEEEEEDDDASWLTPELDLQILQTIAAIKTKDPKVYDPSAKFYTDDVIDKTEKSDQKKGKKITLKDYEREMLLKHGGRIEEEERVDDDNEDEPVVMTYNEEQVAIKDAFKQAAFGDNEETEDHGEEDGFLTKRSKTAAEEEDEGEEYREFILKNLANDKASAIAFKDWNNYKENPNVTSDDAFLINYVLNRGWIGKKDETPTYEQIVNVDEEEEHLDQVDRFESKYNFRFEEEGGAQIVSHERNPEGSVRRKESKRKRERERKKLKKQLEKQAKQEEMEKMKTEKKKEIHERLIKIKQASGEVSGLENIDFDADFDSKAWDEQMAKVFDDKYYEGGEMEKPVWDDDLGEELPWEDEEENWSGTKRERDDKDGDDDADENTKKARKEYKKLKEEYDSLGYEDIIGGDTPTRYKYSQTTPENFGLTCEEILMADDKELNKYVSLRTLAPYRKQELAEREFKMFSKQKNSKYRDLRKHLDKKGGSQKHQEGNEYNKHSENKKGGHYNKERGHKKSSHSKHWKGKNKA
ncbi:KRRI-Interacting protein 1 [Apophysomyces sp. BC1034]|nr:KRRI-Interacting protein 1 [Apophysomyces sp. BC1015]KAG0181316.1 KRRI-Interacting protein 1 [Apophysomyces sp. BC1021]KAG0189317.1 KRRI-Interacting protein 1 [Apophysomyces sp. BC1034]